MTFDKSLFLPILTHAIDSVRNNVGQYALALLIASLSGFAADYAAHYWPSTIVLFNFGYLIVNLYVEAWHFRHEFEAMITNANSPTSLTPALSPRERVSTEARRRHTAHDSIPGSLATLGVGAIVTWCCPCARRLAEFAPRRHWALPQSVFRAATR